jgi:hypothetical protein
VPALMHWFLQRYLRELMEPVAGCLIEIASRNDLKSMAQQADVIYMVNVRHLCFEFY